MSYLSAGFPLYFEKNIFQSHWQLTQRCNFHCSYCVNRHLRSQGIHMPENLMQRALKMMAPLDADRFHFCLTGGEPSLYPHLDSMLASIKQLFPDRASVTLMSNGSAKAERMKALLEEFLDLNLRFVITIHLGQTDLSGLIEKLQKFSPNERKRNFTLKIIASPGDIEAERSAAALRNAELGYEWLPVLDFQKGSLIQGYSSREIERFINRKRKPWFYFRHLSGADCEDVTFVEGIAKNMFRYKGMKCAAGRQSIFLDEYGNVSKGQFCGHMPYTILEKNPFEDPEFYKETICGEEHCSCVPFTALPKWSNPSLAPVSLQEKNLKADLAIIIPAHNQASSIARALDSIAHQRGIKPEIIVVDDASEDDLAAVMEQWHSAHPDVKLTFLQLPERSYALGARVAGIRASHAADIIFVDADDRLAATDVLAKILQKKRETGAEIAHFPSILKDAQGNLLGDAYFDLPLANGLLDFEQKLEKYTSRSWPPSELWGKIYSRKLLLKVIQWLAPEKVYRLDTIISTLAMFAASSYLGCDEFAYEYKINDQWPVLKLAQRMHDSLVNEQSFKNMLASISIPQKYVHAWKHGFEDYFLVWNAGKMSYSFSEAESGGESSEKMLEQMRSVLSTDELLAQTLFSTQSNIKKIVAFLDRMHHGF